MSRGFPTTTGFANSLKKTFGNLFAKRSAARPDPPSDYSHQTVVQLTPISASYSQYQRNYHNNGLNGINQQAQPNSANFCRFYPPKKASTTATTTKTGYKQLTMDTIKPRESNNTVSNLINDGLPSPNEVIRQNSNKRGVFDSTISNNGGNMNNNHNNATLKQQFAEQPRQNPFWLEPPPQELLNDRPIRSPGGKYSKASVKSFANMTGSPTNSI